MRRSFRIVASGIAGLILLVILLHRPILLALGRVLVSSGSPVRSDIVVVLGGDYRGNRILKGAELVRSGFAPLVISSGDGNIYGHSESELAVSFAVAHGYPRDSFYANPVGVLSTRDEARADTAELRRRGVHSYILVTSPYHTARAARIFRRTAPDLDLHVVAAPDPNWHSGEWWTDREGQKEWFFESVKTLADFVGL